MKKTFYSNGKLLITGEYLVLDGAKAFALPTKFGQNLIVEKGSNKEFYWKSYDSDSSIWFEDTILFTEITTAEKTEADSIRATLIKILREAYLLNSDYITESNGYKITTQLSFSRNWGLGTSSTLINNIAQWLEIDAFTLLNNSFGGSGYDIACAQNSTPIVYSIDHGQPVFQKVVFDPVFTSNIYFVYLNKKQSSKTAIAAYHRNKKNNLTETIAKIDRITQEVLIASTVQSFAKAITKHELEISAIIETPTVKDTLFPDFSGTVKSLGAWGGDFVMAVSEQNPTAYFKAKGYDIIIPYEEMILKLFL